MDGNPESHSDEKRDFIRIRLRELESKWHLYITGY